MKPELFKNLKSLLVDGLYIVTKTLFAVKFWYNSDTGEMKPKLYKTLKSLLGITSYIVTMINTF
jgi:hypothetical protein